MQNNFEAAARRAQEKGSRALARRIRIEGKIVGTVVREGLKRGWTVSVYDSEEWTLKRSTDRLAIMDALFTTDMDTIRFRDAEDNNMGFVFFVYGNSGYDVINDYAAGGPVEEMMEEVINPLCDRLELMAA
jgi:hypothetical protein